MSLNKLKLNGDKTELLVIRSGNLSASQLPSFTAIDGSVIQLSYSGPAAGEGLVRTVGVAQGPGSVVGMSKIEVLLVPVAIAACFQIPLRLNAISSLY